MIGSKKFLWTVVILLAAIGVVQTVRVKQVQTDYDVTMAQAAMVCNALAERIHDQQAHIVMLETFIKIEFQPEIGPDADESVQEDETVREDDSPLPEAG